MDWVGDLLESDSFNPVETVLTCVVGGPRNIFQKLFGKPPQVEYLEADLASNALAAAEVVAACGGHPSPELPEGLLKWVEHHSSNISPRLSALAIQAIERVQTDSELAELWAESEEFEKWKSDLNNLKTRLA
jgi:hypothetical protein